MMPPPAADVEHFHRDARLAQLGALRDGMRLDQDCIDAAFATLAEKLAEVSRRLAEQALTADFSPPPWPGGIARTLEIKLSESREVTLRMAAEGRRVDRPAQP